MAERVYFRGSREEARQVVLAMVAALTGTSNQHGDLARGVHTAVGFAALEDIYDDFVRKAAGGVGEDGVKWPRLSPKTLAYGRRAPKGRGLAPGGKDGLLTPAQLKRWRGIYGTRLARFAMSMPLGEAKARAAKIAWETVKREGGQTKIAAYANRPHEVLRDTGNLLNSLSPGQTGNSDQVFRSLANGIIVGTNVPYAKTHQEGDAKRGIPARPFLPVKEAPEVWRERWLETGARAVAVALRTALTRK